MSCEVIMELSSAANSWSRWAIQAGCEEWRRSSLGIEFRYSPSSSFLSSRFKSLGICFSNTKPLLDERTSRRGDLRCEWRSRCRSVFQSSDISLSGSGVVRGGNTFTSAFERHLTAFLGVSRFSRALMIFKAFFLHRRVLSSSF